MISKDEIMRAYVFLRTHNNGISDTTLDFMKDSAFSIYDSLNDDYCKKCQFNGKQILGPSECTGCGANGEKRHFKLKVC